MELRDGSMGRASFVERHGLWSQERAEMAERVARLAQERKLEVVRLSFPDQHGLLRGKTIVVDELPLALKSGCTIATTLLAKDTSHRSVYPVFTEGGGFGMPEMTGGADLVMVPDPASFRVLPWAPATGWMLCDIYFPNGDPVPFSTRRILGTILDDLKGQGYDYVSGLEVEFYVFKLEDPMTRPEHATRPAEPSQVSLLSHGFQLLTENRMDELDPVVEILRRNLIELGLPLRSMEVEFGPGQLEFTFDPGVGLEPADTMVLFRGAVKQICRRHGYHATFMCRPGLANLFSSGWHLHQSLCDAESGKNVFAPEAEGEPLSPLGRSFVAGLLEHAGAACAFTTPTINGYKRYEPNSLAPDRVNWARDNRGTMLRIIGGVDDPGTRIENRVGEPAANPYLYAASQILSGMDGVARRLEPPPPTQAPYADEAPPLPKSLIEALAALRRNEMFRTKLGDTFVDYLLTIKEAEIARFLATVTDWEHREYFELF